MKVNGFWIKKQCKYKKTLKIKHKLGIRPTPKKYKYSHLGRVRRKPLICCTTSLKSYTIINFKQRCIGTNANRKEIEVLPPTQGEEETPEKLYIKVELPKTKQREMKRKSSTQAEQAGNCRTTVQLRTQTHQNSK